jgi:predicted metal-dependent HD superfamily phosphohydrolase
VDPAPLAEALLAAYGAPERRYHGLGHLRDCLARLDETDTPDALERDRIEAALWCHDVVYDPRAPDNEERSAAWARRALDALDVPSRHVAEIERLIRCTDHRTAPSDPAARLVCDIDLSILGRAPNEFDAYDAAIRAEYAWVPDESYRAGRRQVLTKLLARRPLYGSEAFQRRYEAAARDNLRRALTRLAPNG